MAVTAQGCEHCGAASFPGERFARVGWRRRAHCPACLTARRTRGLQRDLLGLAAALALAHLVHMPFAPQVTALAGNLVLVAVSLAVGVVLHEAGHAFAARALGFEVHSVRIGQGRLRRAFTFAGLRCEWRGWPDAGLVVASRTELRGLVPRLLAVVLAGPAVTVLAALVLAWAAGAPGSWYGVATSGPAPIQAALVAHLLLSAACLLPVMTRVAGQPQPSDTLLAVLLLASPAQQAKRLAEVAWALRAEERRRLGDVDGAAERLRRGLAEHPDSFVLTHDVARLRLDRGEWHAAREAFVALLGRPEAAPGPMRQILQSNAAFAAALGDQPALHEAAQRESREVLLTGGTQHAFVGTHALALVRTGDVETGAAMARRLEHEAIEPEIRAAALATLALAALASGGIADAAALIARARESDPTSSVTRLVETEWGKVARAA